MRNRLLQASSGGRRHGVAQEELALLARLIPWRWRAWSQPAKLSAGHELTGLKMNLTVSPQPTSFFSPLHHL